MPHNWLISKLRAQYISEQLINGIRSFLRGREQQVVVKGKKSDWQPVTSRNPLGSVLRPFMFVTFINHLSEMTDSDTYLFADDTKNFNNIRSINDRETL